MKNIGVANGDSVMLHTESATHFGMMRHLNGVVCTFKTFVPMQPQPGIVKCLWDLGRTIFAMAIPVGLTYIQAERILRSMPTHDFRCVYQNGGVHRNPSDADVNLEDVMKMKKRTVQEKLNDDKFYKDNFEAAQKELLKKNRVLVA